MSGTGTGREIHAEDVAAAARALPPLPFLTRPPADTNVLLGFVTERRHLTWILEQGLYNLRASGDRGRIGLESPALGADLILLHGLFLPEPLLYRIEGAPQLHTKASMERLNYPRKAGELYICLPISEGLYCPPEVKAHVQRWISERLRNPVVTEPRLLTWLQILEQAAI